MIPLTLNLKNIYDAIDSQTLAAVIAKQSLLFFQQNLK